MKVDILLNEMIVGRGVVKDACIIQISNAAIRAASPSFDALNQVEATTIRDAFRDLNVARNGILVFGRSYTPARVDSQGMYFTSVRLV